MERFTYNKMDTVYVPWRQDGTTCAGWDHRRRGEPSGQPLSEGSIPGADPAGLNLEIGCTTPKSGSKLQYSMHGKLASPPAEAV